MPDHKGMNALGVLMELECLCQAPDLTMKFIMQARDDLRSALLTGVSVV